MISRHLGRTKALCCRALFALAATSHLILADTAIATAGTQQSPELRVPGQVPVAELWRWFDEVADPELFQDGQALLFEFGGTSGPVDPAFCRERAAEIDRVLAGNPVSLALWRLSYLCADAADDEGRAERDLAAFAALSEYAFSNFSWVAQDERPIRVTSEHDIHALIEASDQEVLYMIHIPRTTTRHLLVQVALWDRQGERERVLSFDYLESYVRVNRAIAESVYPAFRFYLAAGLIDNLSSYPNDWAATSLALRRALEQTDLERRLAAIAAVTSSGNAGAAIVFAAACLLHVDSGCAERAVDALLPWAERRYSMPTVLLAVAFHLGRGVEPDPDAVERLLKVADRRLGGARGTLQFVVLSSQADDFRGLPEIVRRNLADAGDGGDVVAAGMHEILMLAIGSPDHSGSDSWARLRGLAEHGTPTHRFLFGQMLRRRNVEEGIEHLHRAAADGSVRAQVELARLYHEGEELDQDAARSRYWRAQAAHGGDADSATWLGTWHWLQGDLGAAQGWYESAYILGDAEAGLQLARLILNGGQDITGTAADAYRALRDLDVNHDSAPARRELARLLAMGGDDVDADPAEAVRLLEIDSERGDLSSRAMLGAALLEGLLPARPDLDGEALLRSAVEAGDAVAKMRLARAIHGGQTARGDPAEVKRLLIEAAEADVDEARADLAWLSCTSNDEVFYDPERGYAQAVQLDGAMLPPVSREAIAACFAEAGEFERAIEIQRHIVDELEWLEASAETIADARKYLERYERKESPRDPID